VVSVVKVVVSVLYTLHEGNYLYSYTSCVYQLFSSLHSASHLANENTHTARARCSKTTEIAVFRLHDRRQLVHTRAQVRLQPRTLSSHHLHSRHTRWRAHPRAQRGASHTVKSQAMPATSTRCELRKSRLYGIRDYAHDTSVLQQHLQNPPTPRMPMSPTSPGFPSPPVSGSSRLGFLNKSPAPDSPASPHTIRRKSSFGISLKTNKSDDVKLPREFLLDFWGALANEDGDAGWKAGVVSFLSMIKKGTKTEAGMNLREIPTLLEGKSQQWAAGSSSSLLVQSAPTRKPVGTYTRASHALLGVLVPLATSAPPLQCQRSISDGEGSRPALPTSSRGAILHGPSERYPTGFPTKPPIDEYLS
jgi:hypothetical protein